MKIARMLCSLIRESLGLNHDRPYPTRKFPDPNRPDQWNWRYEIGRRWVHNVESDCAVLSDWTLVDGAYLATMACPQGVEPKFQPFQITRDQLNQDWTPARRRPDSSPEPAPPATDPEQDTCALGYITEYARKALRSGASGEVVMRPAKSLSHTVALFAKEQDCAQCAKMREQVEVYSRRTEATEAECAAVTQEALVTNETLKQAQDDLARYRAAEQQAMATVGCLESEGIGDFVKRLASEHADTVEKLGSALSLLDEARKALDDWREMAERIRVKIGGGGVLTLGDRIDLIVRERDASQSLLQEALRKIKTMVDSPEEAAAVAPLLDELVGRLPGESIAAAVERFKRERRASSKRNRVRAGMLRDLTSTGAFGIAGRKYEPDADAAKLAAADTDARQYWSNLTEDQRYVAFWQSQYLTRYWHDQAYRAEEAAHHATDKAQEDKAP